MLIRSTLLRYERDLFTSLWSTWMNARKTRLPPSRERAIHRASMKEEERDGQGDDDDGGPETSTRKAQKDAG